MTDTGVPAALMALLNAITTYETLPWVLLLLARMTRRLGGRVTGGYCTRRGWHPRLVPYGSGRACVPDWLRI